MQNYFTARQPQDLIFLKEEAAHIIRYVFFKNPAEEVLWGVNPKDAGDPFGTNE